LLFSDKHSLGQHALGWMLLVLLGATAFLGGNSSVTAQTTTVKAAPVGEQGPRWRDLTRSQRQSLASLETVWLTISADKKLKWIEIAQRMPAMPEDERARVQLRMAEWVMLGPAERGIARLNFQEAKQVKSETRQAQWKAYQALPDDEKRQLADSRKVQPPGPPTASLTSGSRSAKVIADKKSKIVTNPTFAIPPTPVAPTLVHPSYGATTTLVTKKPTPPLHQQVGLPKIATTPEFVDPKTLLPRRGPQAAATFTATASTEALERP
jgi:Protein of unknown function (DUF3106)